MGLCAAVASFVLQTLPIVELPLRIAGAGYIAFLAVRILRGVPKSAAAPERPLGFIEGCLLQLLNPKVVVYGLTLYSTFLAPLVNSVPYVALSIPAVAGIGFVAVTTWALAGSALFRLLTRTPVRRAVTAALSLLLLYSAVDVSGVLTYPP